MLPTAFQKMRANRGDLQPRSVVPAPLEILRSNRLKAGEASIRGLLRRINRIDYEMTSEWAAARRTQHGHESFVMLDFLSEAPDGKPARRQRQHWWWPFRVR